ncbi:hypothetical protein GCM10017767_25950 [Halomonas urumqiensis]|nr:hypothetical protein GCM10017767_25950 [Halomonas urumqiensis]
MVLAIASGRAARATRRGSIVLFIIHSSWLVIVGLVIKVAEHGMINVTTGH